ncbi:P-loop NTPase [Marmoricola sp. URHB0036]|uniref:AAA family ATPase n=1 Tax=Marmoricola sp. URHB0036 TaxID=1298863 RepID=UPI000405D18D|nr:P-loop NTPase [Marmoricola sp. URHB0036]
MPILVEPDSTTAGVLTSALPGGAQVVARADEVEGWLNGRGEYALVIGPTLEMTAAVGLAERVRTGHPGTSIVLTRLELEPQVYAQAMQAGIGAVVAADDHAALGTAVTRARSTWEAIHGPTGVVEGERQGQVFMVFSPKGGVGKTTMAVNLSVALARTGVEVCVVDLDLAFGDVAITMQLIPEHTITEAAVSEDDMDFSLLQKLLTRHESGLTILAAPTHPEGRDLITASLARRVVQTLRRHFDYVVIDTPPGFDDQVLGAFDETDECIIVATLDVPTIKNTKVAIETLDLLNLVPGNRHLVLNRADEEVGLNQGNVEDILGIKVAVALPSSPAVASATNHGQPIVLSKPDHPVSKAIIGLAMRLAGESAHAKPAEPAKRGLFGRKK